jgi:hypothetical protein
VVTDLLAGRISLDHLRGRCTLPMAAQAAEVALRSRLGLVGLDDVRPLGVRREGADTLARFDTAEGAWEVTVTTTRDETALLTCSARRENPLPRHAVVSIEALAGS